MSQALPVFIFFLLCSSPAFSAVSDIVETSPSQPLKTNPHPAAATPPEPAKLAPLPFTPSRGQLLYEHHCLSCHESVLHIRSNRKVSSFAEIQHQVIHWSGVLKLTWKMEEISDVTQYLNSRYYKLEQK